jgi:hypothetical protein
VNAGYCTSRINKNRKTRNRVRQLEALARSPSPRQPDHRAAFTRLR